jgi:hypothetical protein
MIFIVPCQVCNNLVFVSTGALDSPHIYLWFPLTALFSRPLTATLIYAPVNRVFIPCDRCLMKSKEGKFISNLLSSEFYFLWITDSISISDFAVSNDGMTYKECERKRFWLNLNCLHRVCTEGLRKLLRATAEITRPRTGMLIGNSRIRLRGLNTNHLTVIVAYS